MQYSLDDYKTIPRSANHRNGRLSLAPPGLIISRELKEDELGLIDSDTGEWEPKVAEVPGLKDEKAILMDGVICLRRHVLVFTRCR